MANWLCSVRAMALYQFQHFMMEFKSFGFGSVLTFEKRLLLKLLWCQPCLTIWYLNMYCVDLCFDGWPFFFSKDYWFILKPGSNCMLYILCERWLRYDFGTGACDELPRPYFPKIKVLLQSPQHLCPSKVYSLQKNSANYIVALFTHKWFPRPDLYPMWTFQ